jgi:hypothetical protein
MGHRLPGTFAGRVEMNEEEFEATKTRLLSEMDAKLQAMHASLEKQRKSAIEKFEARR